MKNLLLALIALTALAATTVEAIDPAQSPAPGPVPAATGPQATPASAPAANLPPAAELFKRSVQAIGGEEAVRKHTSMRMKGTIAAQAMGMQGDMEILMLAPNRYLTTIDMKNLGRMEQGFDGTVGWSKNPMMGTQLIEGKALDELRRSADFFKDTDPSRLWPTANTVAVTEFAGHRCHEVAVKGDMGEGSLFFDVEGGLPRGMRLSVETPMGKVPATTRYLEYKAFDGVQVATVSEIEAMGAAQTMTVESVSYDPIDAKLFEQPADVKALVQGGKKSAPPASKAGAPAFDAGGALFLPPCTSAFTSAGCSNSFASMGS